MSDDDTTYRFRITMPAAILRMGPLGIAALPQSAMPAGMKAAIKARLELESAAMRMTALCSSAELINIAATEAKRRESLMTPTEALNSVADDLAHGRLK